MHEKNLLKLREKFETNLGQLERSYEEKLTDLTDALELQRKVEIHEMEERKNLHINDLMKNHQKAFGQIKDYYNEITTGNLKLIKELKVWRRLWRNRWGIEAGCFMDIDAHSLCFLQITSFIPFCSLGYLDSHSFFVLPDFYDNRYHNA